MSTEKVMRSYPTAFNRDRGGPKSPANSNENGLKPVVLRTLFSGFFTWSSPGIHSWAEVFQLPTPRNFGVTPEKVIELAFFSHVDRNVKWKPVETSCASNPLQWVFHVE